MTLNYVVVVVVVVINHRTSGRWPRWWMQCWAVRLRSMRKLPTVNSRCLPTPRQRRLS